MELYPMPPQSDYFIYPNYDCKPSHGETKPTSSQQSPPGGAPGCLVTRGFPFQGRVTGRFPRVGPADYSK
jgi:hypothetical protein